ncbi:MBL fold metallo-hydrolase [Natronobiforma cellulositropha]|uniref:MBL fold metallo-hydrolase n=1 Tax=Natronobiforma cellulositropha TaxID=1679076 RepID=UPI0021D5CB0F|nr:MBL fold metallo-hydrolase [Natronobiforma cellulositropha]
MSVTYESLTLERLGHASVRITTDDGLVVYVDPWSGALDSAPRDGDVVFVTHDDADHYDPEAIEAVAAPDATVAAYRAIDTSALEFAVVGLELEGETAVEGIGVRTVPGYNDPEGPHVDDEGAPFHADGEVIGLVLTLDGVTVCYPSDTDVLPHHESLEVDVLLPPIGGHYTMDRHEAAAFARRVDPDLVLPVHYDTFDAIETDVDAFLEELAADGIDARAF